MHVIYADILVAINLAVDYLLLFATARLFGAQFKRIRGFFGAAVGALYSLSVLFDLSGTIFALISTLFSGIMIRITFGKRNIKDFIKLLVIFYICGFLFSGFMVLINSLAKNDSFFAKGGIVYFDFSAMEIVISTAVALIITEILRRIFRHGEPEGACMVKIRLGGKTAVLKGFVDTGNNLSEPFSGSPVAVAYMDSLKKILPEDMYESISKNSLSTDKRLKTIFCSTVSGTVLMNSFRPDEMIIINGSGEFFAEDVLVAASENVPENTVILGKNILLSEKYKTLSEV